MANNIINLTDLPFKNGIYYFGEKKGNKVNPIRCDFFTDEELLRINISVLILERFFKNLSRSESVKSAYQEFVNEVKKPMEMQDCNRRFYLQSGDMDGVALQIGYQPLQRCAHQSGYIYPMRNEQPLQGNWRFEKLRFNHTVELSRQVFDMMDGGKKVFQNEGVTELRDFIDQIKHSVVFAMDELRAVYDCDGINKTIFPTIEDLKKSLSGYIIADGTVKIQEDPIVYNIPKDILDEVNSHYDGKDLMAAIGGMLHQKYPDQEYRKQRCIEIYGKLI